MLTWLPTMKAWPPSFWDSSISKGFRHSGSAFKYSSFPASCQKDTTACYAPDLHASGPGPALRCPPCVPHLRASPPTEFGGPHVPLITPHPRGCCHILSGSATESSLPHSHLSTSTVSSLDRSKSLRRSF